LDSASETLTSTNASFTLALAAAITRSSTKHLAALGAFGEPEPSAGEVGDSAAIEQVQDIGVTAERVVSESEGEKRAGEEQVEDKEGGNIVAGNETDLTELEEVNASSGAEKEKGNEDLDTNTFI
jgi:hypothetical protein